MKKKLYDFFELKKYNTNIKIELIAGFTTFLSMAYILTVNPNNILLKGSADPRYASVFIATALGAFLGTLLMSLIAKMPLVQAPGMGLNAMIGTIIGGAIGFSYSYGNSMMLVLISGIIFLLMSIIPCGVSKDNKKITIREKIYDGVPKPILKSITVGIGLFIAFIGLQNAGIIVSNKFTLVELVKFNDPKLFVKGSIVMKAIVALFGLVVITILDHKKVKGSIVIGILLSTILAIPLGVADINILLGRIDGISWKFWNNTNNFLVGSDSVFLSIFKDGLSFPEGSLLTSVMLIISFCMIDMFDTMGTVVGCCKNANLMDKDDKPINYSKIMYSDSFATIIGSLFGTSTVTTFVESGTGIAAGGKTGLTSLTASLLFLISIFLLPLFAFIPSSAAASALIYVGVLMIKNVKDIDFNTPKNAVPSFMTIIVMLLGYSITEGIGIGIILYVVIDILIYLIDYFKYLFTSKYKEPKLEINIVTIIISILFLLYFIVPMV